MKDYFRFLASTLRFSGSIILILIMLYMGTALITDLIQRAFG